MKKTIIISIIALIMIVGVCGCMQQKSSIEVKKELLREYAVDKYGTDVQVEYFKAALDDSYTNVLTLSKGDCLFNVYQRGKNGEIYDDLPKMTISQKLTAYLSEQVEQSIDECEISAYFMFYEANGHTYRYAWETETASLLKENDLLKVVAIVKISEPMENKKNDLFAVYQKLIEWDPKYIDFEVIQVDGESDELTMMMENLAVKYDDEWEKIPEVKSYLSVQDIGIASADDLIRGEK